MFKACFRVLLVGYLFLSVSVLANSVMANQQGKVAKNRGYDCQFSLISSLDSVNSMVLDESVYRCVKFSDLRDMTLINRQGQVLPFTLQPIRKKPQLSTVLLPFYQAPQLATVHSKTMLEKILSLSHISALGEWQGSQELYYSSMIVDLSRLSSSLHAIEINSQLNESLEVRLVIEGSNDLDNWRVISSNKTYYRLIGKDLALQRPRFKLPSYENEKYLRLSLLSDNKKFHKSIESVEAQVRQSFTQKPIHWTKITGEKDPEVANRWIFDWQAKLPVKYIQMVAKNNISLYSGTISKQAKVKEGVNREDDVQSNKAKLKALIKQPLTTMRNNREQASLSRWYFSQYFNVYWLKDNNDITKKDTFNINLEHEQALAVTFNQPLDIQQEQLPELLLGWEPHTLTFLAQGEGPYQLLVGKDSVKQAVKVSSVVESILLQAQSETKQKISYSKEQIKPLEAERDKNAQIDTTVTLLSESNWKKYFLWLILAVALIFLATIAFKLSKSLHNVPKD